MVIKYYLACLIVVVFFVNSTILISQKTVTTPSGSVITYTDDGQWLFAEIEVQDSETVNPYEHPEAEAKITPEKKALFDQLIDTNKEREAEFFVAYKINEDNISKCESQISYYKSLGNKDLEIENKELLKRLKDDSKELESKYKESGKRIEKLEKWLISSDVNDDKEFQKMMQDEAILKTTGYQKFIATNGVVKNDWEPFVISKETTLSNQCNIAFNGENPQGDGRLIQYAKTPFFNYTPTTIKPYYREKDYMRAKVSIENIDGDYYLVLNLEFESKDIKKSYGGVRKGEKLYINFIDQSRIYLTSFIDAIPYVEELTGYTKYELVYEIDKESRQQLERNYLDKIGIMYSSGFEEYVIYNVDEISNQLKCIDNVD